MKKIICYLFRCKTERLLHADTIWGGFYEEYKNCPRCKKKLNC